MKKSDKGPSEKVKAAISKVIARFESGDLSPIVDIACTRMPLGLPASGWSFGNRVLAFASTGNIDARGYKQWKEHGRQVKKGETAGYIFGPKVIKTEDETGEEKAICIGFFSIPVFGADQTEGDELPYTLEPKEVRPLKEVAERLNVPVKYGFEHPQAAGMYQYGSKKQIQLFTHDVSVWFHELAHAVHHQVDPDYESMTKNDKEVIAEFTACVLGTMYGYDTTGRSHAYISAYKADTVKSIMSLLGTIENVINYILDEEPAI